MNIPTTDYPALISIINQTYTSGLDAILAAKMVGKSKMLVLGQDGPKQLAIELSPKNIAIKWINSGQKPPKKGAESFSEVSLDDALLNAAVVSMAALAGIELPISFSEAPVLDCEEEYAEGGKAFKCKPENLSCKGRCISGWKVCREGMSEGQGKQLDALMKKHKAGDPEAVAMVGKLQKIAAKLQEIKATGKEASFTQVGMAMKAANQKAVEGKAPEPEVKTPQAKEKPETVVEVKKSPPVEAKPKAPEAKPEGDSPKTNKKKAIAEAEKELAAKIAKVRAEMPGGIDRVDAIKALEKEHAEIVKGINEGKGKPKSEIEASSKVEVNSYKIPDKGQEKTDAADYSAASVAAELVGVGHTSVDIDQYGTTMKKAIATGIERADGKKMFLDVSFTGSGNIAYARKMFQDEFGQDSVAEDDVLGYRDMARIVIEGGKARSATAKERSDFKQAEQRANLHLEAMYAFQAVRDAESVLAEDDEYDPEDKFLSKKERKDYKDRIKNAPKEGNKVAQRLWALEDEHLGRKPKKSVAAHEKELVQGAKDWAKEQGFTAGGVNGFSADATAAHDIAHPAAHRLIGLDSKSIHKTFGALKTKEGKPSLIAEEALVNAVEHLSRGDTLEASIQNGLRLARVQSRSENGGSEEERVYTRSPEFARGIIDLIKNRAYKHPEYSRIMPVVQKYNMKSGTVTSSGADFTNSASGG